MSFSLAQSLPQSLRWGSVRCCFVGALAIQILVCWISVAAAQNEPVRTVVLDVEGGGADLLRTEIDAIDNVETEDQDWFLEQLRSQKVHARRIMKRPEDLKLVMEDANIRYIIAVQASDKQWEGGIYDGSGELVHKFGIMRLTEELNAESASVIRREFEEVTGLAQPEEIVLEEPAPQEDDVEPEASQSEPVPDGSMADPQALELAVAVGVFKRDLSFIGAGSAVLSFQSAFYPGGSIDAVFFPEATVFDAGDLGFWVGLVSAFDSLQPPEGDSLTILQLEGAAGVSLRPLAARNVEFRIGGAHHRFTLGDNSVFPSLTRTALVLGLRSLHDLDPFGVETALEAFPFAVYGQGADLFGESNYTYGFAGRLNLRYAVVASVNLTIGLHLRILRSSFPGIGQLDFSDTHGFELVWGPKLGVTWPR